MVGTRGRRAQLLASPAQEAGARIDQPSGEVFFGQSHFSLPSPLSPTPGSPLAKGKSTINFFPGQMGSSQQCTVRMHRPFLFLQSCLPGRPPERQMNTLILSGILQSLSGRLPPAPRSLHFNLQQGRDASSGQDGRGRAWPWASALHSGAEADRGSVHPPARLGFQGIGIMIYIPPGL